MAAKKSTRKKNLNPKKSFLNHNKIYKTKAFGRFNINRIFKESDVRRDKKGKFAKKWTNVKDFLRDQLKKTFKKRGIYDASKFSIFYEKLQKKKAKIRGKTYRRTGINNVKRDGKSTSFDGNLLYFMENLRKPTYKPMLVSDRAQLMQPGEKNTKQIVTNIKQLREDYGDEAFKILSENHFLALMSSESRNKLLKTFIKSIEDQYGFTKEESFYSMKQYREYIDKKLGKGSFTQLIKNEYQNSTRIQDFLSSLEFKKLRTYDLRKNKQLITTPEDWEGLYKESAESIDNIKDNGDYRNVNTNENKKEKQWFIKLINNFRNKYEKLLPEYLDKLKIKAENQGKPFDHVETEKSLNKSMDSILNYIKEMQYKYEVFRNRKIIGHRNKITKEAMNLLSDVEILGLYYQSKLEFLSGNYKSNIDPLILKLEAISIAKNEHKNVDFNTVGEYEIHHHLQFSTKNKKTGETVLGIEQNKEGKVQIKTVSFNDLQQMRPVFDENGQIKYYKVEGAKLKKERDNFNNEEVKETSEQIIIPKQGFEDRIVTAKQKMPDFNFNDPNSILNPLDIVGFKTNSGETVGWRYQLEEIYDGNDDIYIDLPSSIHQDRETDTAFYEMLHPTESLNVNANINSIKAIQDVLPTVENDLGIPLKGLTDYIEKAYQTNTLKAGKGQIESEYHTKFRNEIKKIRKLEFLDTLEEEIGNRNLTQQQLDKIEYIFIGKNHTRHLNAVLKNTQEKLAFVDTAIQEYDSLSLDSGKERLMEVKKNTEQNIAELEVALINLDRFIQSKSKIFPDVDLNSINPFNTNIDQIMNQKKEALGLPADATNIDVVEKLLDIFHMKLKSSDPAILLNDSK